MEGKKRCPGVLGVFFIFAGSVILSSGCSSTNMEAASADDYISDIGSVESPAAAEIAPLAGIPVENNSHVKKWIEYFTEKDRERFLSFLQRGSKYKEVVESILEENGVPAELFYLAMIESGYQTLATSRAKAAGVWQFIHATGRRYGLQTDQYVDERRDPIRATEAAAKYLRDLYNVFGSWHLALAAYNSGEYRVMNAIIKGKSRDFWELKAKKILPQETCEYVPKFMAAVLIGQNPAKYGFAGIKEAKYPDLESIEVPSPVRINFVSRVAGVPVADLERVNPHLKKGMTPPRANTYEIWVPAQYASAVTVARPKLESGRLRGFGPGRNLASVDSKIRHYHIVRSGENLAVIARKYSTSIIHLKQVNGLMSNRIYPGMRIRTSARSYRSAENHRYRVKSGDSLYSIALAHGISVQMLKRLNSLKGNSIFVGQGLRTGKGG